MSLKNKFLIIFLSLTIIPVILITSYTYNRYTKLVKDQTRQVTDTVFDRAKMEANEKLGNLNHISQLFNFYNEQSPSLIDELKKYSDPEAKHSYYEIFKSNQNISFLCKNLIFNYDYINGIFIFTPSGVTLGYGYGNSIDIKPDYQPFDEEWYKNTVSQNGGFYTSGITKKDFIINSQPSISISQAIYDVYTRKYLGVLLIDCSPALFDLSAINPFSDMISLQISTKNGRKLYDSSGASSETTVPGRELRKEELDNPDFLITLSANYDALYNQFGATRIMILTIAALCLLVIIVISVLVSSSISRPIVYLSERMKDQDGSSLFTSSKYLNRNDEIGILYNEYNRMIETLDEYIRKELQNKLITLDSQMKSLEAQINSHFLYNTLESINSIAEIEGIESISTMSLALGDMFRYSIKTQSELVKISDELKHVQDYIAIQTIRFDDKFRYSVEMPSEMQTLRVLKLILQPLVENALYHGLLYCRCGSSITVSGRIEDRTILLTVADDGAGLSEEQLKELRGKLKEKALFTELGHRNKQSIGIKNIHTRIILYYGEGYGLSIESRQGYGTQITISLPVLD